MIVAYVAGPYRARTAWGIETNVRAAEEVALQLWQAGIAVVCPHTNTRFFDGAAPDETFLQGDLEILSRCDVIVMVGKWQSSVGARAERDFAERSGLKVFYSATEALLWLSLPEDVREKVG